MTTLPLPLEDRRSLAVVRSLEDLRSLVAYESHQLALAGSTDPSASDASPCVFGDSDDTTEPKSSRWHDWLHSTVRPRDGDDEAAGLVDMEALATRTASWDVHAWAWVLFPLARRLEVARGMAHGLAEVHAGKTIPNDVFLAGTKTTTGSDFAPVAYVHRDVKPQNYFLDRTRPWRVKLGDFGDAKHAAKSTLSQSSGMGPVRHGTTPFMAPEVFALGTEGSASKPSYPSDVDSLGMAMFMLLALHRASPWTLEITEAEIERAVRSGRRPDGLAPLDPEEQGVGIAGPYSDRAVVSRWMALLSRCWDVDPASRPTALEVALELSSLRNALA
jgi:serine/threonine protein kinase